MTGLEITGYYLLITLCGGLSSYYTYILGATRLVQKVDPGRKFYGFHAMFFIPWIILSPLFLPILIYSLSIDDSLKENIAEALISVE